MPVSMASRSRVCTGNLNAMVSPATPVVDPIRRPHLAAVDPDFRLAIEHDVEHCRDLLTYLRDR